ncbi:Heterokaryon incompatibility protein 6 [Colletotrichum gloeosporioides]|uniref:Heterokaryon incompatibility protein 6 n=1 Tax=Colletotrichum gloeosporioides TaxID=474922 RepID=A0A8H4FGB7_COLGL|nr:Heterokaryon incompatibility protein 6 [Colletotrichum gloeosporioides]KAF3801348.1 Heterokaryon incompatibility protein 6 [Colletotrichum gloeosporioides]
MVIYPPLDAAKHEIRLVRLLRPLAEHAKSPVRDIALELRTVSLDDGVSYAALSYVWGNPADTEKIKINGCPSVVTRSLHNALEQFHKKDFRSWLWIDAMCIEQSNLAEKNHQVKMMGDIYSGAEVVYMWLGLGTEDTDVVMDLVSRFGPGLHAGGALDLGVKWGAISRLVQEISAAFPEDDDYDEQGYEDVPEGWGLGVAVYGLRRKVYKTQGPICRGLEGILTRSYWSRIWIIQEVVLAPRAVVMVGTRSAPVELFDATLFTMDRTAIVSSLGLGGTACLVLSLGTRRTCGREDFARPRLQDLLWERRVASGRPHYAASDPRDLVFGILGLLSEEEKRVLRADYAQSYVDVFAQATRTMLRTGEKGRGDFLFCLADLPPGNPDGPLPTWVPDWREVGARGIRTWGVNDARKFRAARDRPQPSREPGDYLDVSRILRRRGCLVDKITDVMEAPEWIGVDSYEPPRQPDVDQWFRAIAAFVRLGPDSGPAESYVWRTVSNGKGHELIHTLPCDCRLAETEGAAALFRKIVRVESIDHESLTAEQIAYIRRDINLFLEHGGPSESQDVEQIARRWRQRVGNMNRRRTLFKTAKGMFGLCHVGAAIGDVVTLVWGVESPIILRPRDERSFYFRGDAYVDGIMQGEFLDTKPRETEFVIH